MRLFSPITWSTHDRKELSRRNFVLSLAAAAPAVLLASRGAQAQADGWREYRNETFGFGAELPAEPEVEAEEDEHKDIWIRTIEAKVDHEQTTYSVHCTEWKRAMPDEPQYQQWREAMRLAGMAVTSERSFTMNGFPGHEFVRESDDINYIRREVAVGNLTIAASVTGDRDVHRSATVRRFLDSFRLLRGAR
jgi:hypothetical protein